MIFSPPFSLKNPWIHERAKITPDDPAIIYDNEIITFLQLYRRSLSRAQQLKALAVQQGDIVASLLDNGLSAVEIFHAAQLCGATLLPLNKRLTATEIAFQLNETEPKALITEPGKLISLARQACNNLDCPPLLATDFRDEQAITVRKNPQVPWVILYTSGTTGTPKGVPLKARHFGASALASISHLGTEINDKWLCCVPLFHIAGLSILTRSVLTGACVVLHDHFDVEKVSRDIEEQQITLMSLVPTMLHRLVKLRSEVNNAKKETTISMRVVLIGGASCSQTLWQQALDLGFPVLRTYGLTEGCSMVATEPLVGKSNNTPSVAKVLPGVEIKIVNSKGRSVNRYEEGEILIRGRMVMDHYYKRVEESARALQQGWLHSGDIGYLDRQGGLCVLNRRSDLIVSGGENIYPAEIEASLVLHPAIEEVCVTGEDDGEFGQRAVAWVVKEKGVVTSKEELQLYCRKTLAGYKIPRRIIFIEQLPKNASGKIMRQEIGKK